MSNFSGVGYTAKVIEAGPEPIAMVMNAHSLQVTSLPPPALPPPPPHRGPPHPPLPSPGRLWSRGTLSKRQEEMRGSRYFIGEQVCQPHNQLHILWLNRRRRLESIGEAAEGAIWAQVHVGFLPRAVSPAGSLALPAPFELTSPCAGHAEEDCRSHSSPGAPGETAGHRFNHRSICWVLYYFLFRFEIFSNKKVSFHHSHHCMILDFCMLQFFHNKKCFNSSSCSLFYFHVHLK